MGANARKVGFVALLILLHLLAAATVYAAEHSTLIVDWGHDWGNGWYRQPPERDANPAWKPLAREDLNGNGDFDDDYIGGWEFSLDVPLSPTNVIYDYTYPSARFYGAAIVSVTDRPKKEDGEGYVRFVAPTEGHINQNHELRDDWNLMSFPTVKRKPDASRYAGAMLVIWKKEDFLNGGGRHRVSFAADSSIGIFVSRYWGGLNWGRWIVQEGGRLYISEDTFAGQKEQFNLDMSVELEEAEKLPNGARNPVVRTTHTVNPGATRWAEYHPEAPHKVFFDEAAADFQKREFSDVQAVGFLAQRNMSTGYPVAGGLWKLPHGVGEPIALKFNAAQVRAVVHSPNDWSDHVQMLPVDGLHVAATETTYGQWLEVWRWAVTNQRCRRFTPGFEDNEIPGYSFLRDGAMGSMETAAPGEYGPQEPVTGISWYDAVLWCNALSELEGLQPAYYDDPEFRTPARTVFERSKLEERDNRRPVYWKRDSTGYRLPTPEEFARAAGGKIEPATAWLAQNSGGRTHPAGTSAPGAHGLHDLYGNVAEYVWDAAQDVYDPGSRDWHIVLGGSFRHPADENAASLLPFGEMPFEGSYDIGFRVVRGAYVKPAAAAGAGSVPERRLTRGMRVKPAAAPDMAVLRREVEQMLAPVKFAGAGSLPVTDNQERNYGKAEGGYDLSFARVETPYRIWNIVRQWAVMEKGYRFNHAGDMGSTHFTAPEAQQATRSELEPVTNLTWLDAVVWCNALSEFMGREPVYLRKDGGEVLRDASTLRLPMYAEYAYPNTGRYKNRPVDTAAVIAIKADTERSGFRLPTLGEFEAVHQRSKDADKGWFSTNSGLRTHPVASSPAPANGLYDLDGNVKEMTYGGCSLFGQIRFGNSFACAPGVYPHTMTRKDHTSVGRSYVGFRVVCRP